STRARLWGTPARAGYYHFRRPTSSPEGLREQGSKLFPCRPAARSLTESYFMRTALTTPSSLGFEVTLAFPSSVSIVAPRVMTPLLSYSLFAGFAVTRMISDFTVLLLEGSKTFAWFA